MGPSHSLLALYLYPHIGKMRVLWCDTRWVHPTLDMCLEKQIMLPTYQVSVCPSKNFRLDWLNFLPSVPALPFME